MLVIEHWFTLYEKIHLLCLGNGDQTLESPRLRLVLSVEYKATVCPRPGRMTRISKGGDILYIVTWEVARVTSFKKAILICLLNYARCLWLDFQYPLHSESIMASSSLSMPVAQEGPHDLILANEMGGSVFWGAFEKFPICRRKGRRGWLLMFCGPCCPWTDPWNCCSLIYENIYAEKKRERTERTQISELHLWPFKFAITGDKYSNCLDQFELGLL